LNPNIVVNVSSVVDGLAKIEFWAMRFSYSNRVHTGWPISKETHKKSEYLDYGSTTRARFFTKDTGMFTLQIHTDKVSENLC
jgi:hypothetical protein